MYVRQCRWQVHVYAAMPLASSCICGNAAGKRQCRGQVHVYAAMPLGSGNAAGKLMYMQCRFLAQMSCRIIPIHASPFMHILSCKPYVQALLLDGNVDILLEKLLVCIHLFLKPLLRQCVCFFGTPCLLERNFVRGTWTRSSRSTHYLIS